MRKYVFADEAGCLSFRRQQGVSRYFILCTVVLEDCAIGNNILSLKRDLALNGSALDKSFHATTDKQNVRDEVFALLQSQRFRIDATILEKSKAQPHVRTDEIKFYQYAWFYHFKHIARVGVINQDDELLLAAACIGTNKKKAAFRDSINNVVQQCAPTVKWQTAFWPADSDPCLQITDYCAWAIQIKWEMGDPRSYRLVDRNIASEFDLWRKGTKHYY